MEKTISLRPVKESPDDYDELEQLIKDAFWQLLHKPMMQALELPQRLITNDRNALLDAIASGRIMFSRGVFSGRFSAEISRELKHLGATWDRRSSTFKLLLAEMPQNLRMAISASEARFQERLKKLNEKLAQNLPAEIAGMVDAAPLFPFDARKS